MPTPIEIVLRSQPQRRRPRRIRPAKFPLSAERRYVAANRKLQQQLSSVVIETLIPRLAEVGRLGGFRVDAARNDQAFWREMLARIFGDMRGRWEFAAGVAERVAEDAAGEINQANRIQIQRQMRQAVGVDVFADDGDLVDTMEQFASDNVSRITTVSETVFPRLERIVANGYRSGLRADAISAEIIRQLGIEEGRAAFWARDQIGSLNGQLTRQRQTSIGIDEYIWRTSRDELVRKTHRQLEGTKHSWDDPPTVGGRQVHPGEDYNCRCTADPVIPGIENIKTSRSDVPRDPDLVARKRARDRRRRTRETRRLARAAETA